MLYGTVYYLIRTTFYLITVRLFVMNQNQQAPIPLGELLLQVAKTFQEVAPQIQASLREAQELFASFLEQNSEFFEQLERFLKELQYLPERQREAWVTAAERGWYMNATTPASMRRAVLDSKDALDCYMVEHLEKDWAAITESILSAHPERREILECAFQLHTEGRYIAAIPLMLAQADGICAQALGAHLFTDHEKRDAKLTEMGSNTDSFIGILLSVLGLKTQFSAGISKYSAPKKALAPNRNGILHGSHRHLDYGTKTNSLKTFSLLAFITFILARATTRKITLVIEKET